MCYDSLLNNNHLIQDLKLRLRNIIFRIFYAIFTRIFLWFSEKKNAKDIDFVNLCCILWLFRSLEWDACKEHLAAFVRDAMLNGIHSVKLLKDKLSRT